MEQRNGTRGGDEINFIHGGGNYGWPLYTNGLNYNGEYITIGNDFRIRIFRLKRQFYLRLILPCAGAFANILSGWGFS